MLTESPQLIGSLETSKLTNVRTNHKVFKQVMQLKKKNWLYNYKNIADYPIYMVKTLSNTYQIYCLNKLEQAVEYYMEYELQKCAFLDTEWVTQIMVWRISTQEFDGITKEFIFDVLLPEFGTLMTDSQQTLDGKNLWERLIRNAYARKLGVYFVNFDSQKVIQLNNMRDYQQLCQQLKPWQDAEFGKMYRFAISEFDLIWK